MAPVTSAEPSSAKRLSHDEEELEPSYGLPERLPAGERMLWQGSPRWQTIARDALHARALAVYFGALLLWRGAELAAGGTALRGIAGAIGPLAALAVTALALVTLIAWLVERTTVYTVTDRRVVMRIGIVLSVTFNLPYRSIEAAGLRLHADGSADIPLQLAGPDRIAYAHLWPHARAWQLRRPQPTLRAVPDGQRVATLLARALADAAGVPRTSLAAVPAPAERAARPRQTLAA